MLQAASPANHNHGSAAHLSANHSPAPQPPRPSPFASPNTPRIMLSVPNYQPIRAPFPPRERGWGERADAAAGYLGSDSVRSTDLFSLIIEGKTNPYPAQPATGVLGQSPKRVLVPFTRVKGTPRRVGVLIRIYKRLAPPKAITDYYLTGRGGWGAGLRFAEKHPRRKATAFSIITPPAPFGAAPHRMA